VGRSVCDGRKNIVPGQSPDSNISVDKILCLNNNTRR
jgi:hypothetical protein